VPQPAQALLAVPIVRAYPSTATVPITVLLYNSRSAGGAWSVCDKSTVAGRNVHICFENVKHNFIQFLHLEYRYFRQKLVHKFHVD